MEIAIPGTPVCPLFDQMEIVSPFANILPISVLAWGW